MSFITKYMCILFESKWYASADTVPPKPVSFVLTTPLPNTHTPQARDIYEESIQTVTTVRDFGQVFDAYAQFEESMINARMETTPDMGASDDGR